jgi:hypothetical protein
MRKFLLLSLITVLGFNYVIGQDVKDTKPEIKYRRSSLHTILIESDKFPYKDTVISAYNNAPFPDKYNNHTIGEKSFNPYEFGDIKIDTTDTAAKADPTGKINYRPVIDNYFAQKKVANKLVAKWFNRQEDGSFDMNLIGERGSYNASEMQANIAKGSARGVSSLADAGVELIGNTFVVVSKFNFVSNEIAARIIRDVAKIAASRIPNGMLSKAASVASDLAYNKMKEGYSVWTTSYLYKLVWNDSTEAVFYNDLWMDKTSLNPAKKDAFDNSDLFKLEFVGDEKATGLVLFSLKEKRSEDKIIAIATVRTIDAVYAKLQKAYDVFKPKVPLHTGEPITAKIGMKEGLEGGEKFEVFEQTQDPKTGLTAYVSKGVIKVDKKLIWDNRYNAGEGPIMEADTIPVDSTAKVEPKVILDRTTFKGGKGFYSGMLIKQLK